MSVFKSIFRNTTARTATEVVNRLGSALFWVFVIRYLSAFDLGAIAYGMAIYKLFNMISSLGLRPLFSKDVARNRPKAGEYFSQILFLGSMAALFLWIAMVGLSFLHDSSGKVLRILSLTLFTGVGMHFGSAMLWAAEKLHWVTVAQTVRIFLLLTVGLIVFNSYQNAETVAWILALSHIVSHLLCLVFASVQVARPVAILNRPVLYYYLQQIPTFISITIAHSAYWTVPIVILTQIKGEQATGYFSAAHKLVDILVAVALAYGQALLPILSKFFKQTEKVHLIIGASLRYVSIITVAAALLIYFSAPHIIASLFGPKMAPSAGVLRLLIWLILPYSMIPILSQFLISHGRQKLDLIANLSGSITAISLSFLLIPLFAEKGLAVSMLAGAVILGSVEWLSVRRTLDRFSLFEQIKFPLLGMVLMGLAMSGLGSSIPVLVIPGGVAVYVFFLMITGSLHELIGLIKRLLRQP
jgi:O-antigen/teichoic acid export membrane protein